MKKKGQWEFSGGPAGSARVITVVADELLRVAGEAKKIFLKEKRKEKEKSHSTHSLTTQTQLLITYRSLYSILHFFYSYKFTRCIILYVDLLSICHLEISM